jgi:hypothetical protein
VVRLKNIFEMRRMSKKQYINQTLSIDVCMYEVYTLIASRNLTNICKFVVCVVYLSGLLKTLCHSIFAGKYVFFFLAGKAVDLG